MTNPPKNDTPDKALVERALEIFNGGLVKEPDAKNPRGFTMMYEPAKAMSAVIAALSQPQHGGLVEAARVVDAVVGSNADGCVSASAAYQKCCQAARAAVNGKSCVVRTKST